MAQLWIEYTDEDGNEGAARWGGGMTDEQIDKVIAFAIEVLGRGPDTLA